MKRAIAAVVALCLAALAPLAAVAQSAPNVTVPFAFSGVGQQITVPLNGQTGCSVAVNSVGGGATLAATASTDNATFNSTIAIGGGSITAIGTYTGLVANAGLGVFRLQATALTSGTASGTITCTSSVLPGTSTAPITCDRSAPITGAAASAVLITHVAGLRTLICSVSLSLTQVATTSAQTLWGTGSVCASNQAGSSPIISQGTIVTGDSVGIAWGSGLGAVDSQPTIGVSDYCLTITGSAVVWGTVRYTQIP